jgi:hypothetical protein
VPARVGTGGLTLSNLPANCTNPGPIAYTGFTTAGLTGQGIVLTCTPPPAAYPVSLTYGPITTGGPTGRQVQIQVRWDVQTQSAVGLSGIIGVGPNLTFQSRQFASTFDFGAQNFSGGGTAGAQLSFAYGAVSPAFETGNFNVVNFTFNIATGFSGTITPTLSISEATRIQAPTNFTASTTIGTIPALIVP